MKRILKIGLVTVCIGIIVYIVWIIFCITIIGSTVSNEIIETVSSPDGSYVAYVFIRDGGATTRESYQLSVLKSENPLNNSSGNTFISYGEFTIKWIDEKTLYVNNNAAEFFKQKTKVNDITINYVYTG